MKTSCPVSCLDCPELFANNLISCSGQPRQNKTKQIQQATTNHCRHFISLHVLSTWFLKVILGSVECGTLMTGKTLGAVGNLFAGIYLDGMDRWVWLGVYLPVQNISGGFLTFIMMTYSFIADNSTNR